MQALRIKVSRRRGRACRIEWRRIASIADRRPVMPVQSRRGRVSPPQSRAATRQAACLSGGSKILTARPVRASLYPRSVGRISRGIIDQSAALAARCVCLKLPNPRISTRRSPRASAPPIKNFWTTISASLATRLGKRDAKTTMSLERVISIFYQQLVATIGRPVHLRQIWAFRISTATHHLTRPFRIWKPH